MAGILYIVATPIGNLGDISRRMVETIEQVDFLAVEDTRVTVKLLNHLGIKKQMVAYHRHNEESGAENILSRILAGENCALLSDAGMPAISDPGETLVKKCAQQEIEVKSVPGACALISALSISALPTGRFTFEGFLAMNKKNRREHLTSLQDEMRTMIFYEAPHKLLSTLKDMMQNFGAQRQVSLSRELTKVHEEVLRFTLEEAVTYFEAHAPKGEFVLVVEGAMPRADDKPTLEEQMERVQVLCTKGSSLRDAVREVAKEDGTSRKELYNFAQQKS